MLLLLLLTVCQACGACCGEPVAAGLADRVCPAVVFVVGGDVADAGVQAYGVVLEPGRGRVRGRARRGRGSSPGVAIRP